MSTLKEQDAEAWFLLEALRQDAVEFGLDPLDNREHPEGLRDGSYRCPVGKHIYRGMAFPQGSLPWLGELDVDGTVPVDHRDIHWRYYFIEPRKNADTEDDVLLGCSVKAKGIGANYHAADQTRHMRDAIEAGKRWCRQQMPSYTWRPAL
ncbi:hypothetical protein [Rhodococcus sp. NPDC058521]|uniref:hypothetical protein n=1 Tax=Rhodococcus sp. NPDC058521 TaxID=3346536 RepID=UPI003655CB2A